MALEAAYTTPGTDPSPPLARYRGHEHRNPPFVPAIGDPAAPVPPTLVLVSMDGIQHRVHGAGPFRWILESSANTAPTMERTPYLLSAQIEKVIAELVGLPEGWDGHGGLPVQPEVAAHTRLFMAAIEESTQLVPDVVPLSDGGLQLEWFVGAYELEVAITPDGETHFHFECATDDRTEEFSLGRSLDTTEIEPFFRELRR